MSPLTSCFCLIVSTFGVPTEDHRYHTSNTSLCATIYQDDAILIIIRTRRICYTWYAILRSSRQLNLGKFKIVREGEKRFPVRFSILGGPISAGADPKFISAHARRSRKAGAWTIVLTPTLRDASNDLVPDDRSFELLSLVAVNIVLKMSGQRSWL